MTDPRERRTWLQVVWASAFLNKGQRRVENDRTIGEIIVKVENDFLIDF